MSRITEWSRRQTDRFRYTVGFLLVFALLLVLSYRSEFNDRRIEHNQNRIEDNQNRIARDERNDIFHAKLDDWEVCQNRHATVGAVVAEHRAIAAYLAEIGPHDAALRRINRILDDAQIALAPCGPKPRR